MGAREPKNILEAIARFRERKFKCLKEEFSFESKSDKTVSCSRPTKLLRVRSEAVAT